MRYTTKTRLRKLQDATFTLKLKDLPNNGLEIALEKDGQSYCIKVYKSVHGLLPAPGRSFSKQRFWEQATLYAEEEVAIINLAVTWHVDGHYNLLGLDLCRPALVGGVQDIGQQKWSIPVPHPATLITLDDVTPPANEDHDSYDRRADEDEDDLDISADEGGK